MTGEGILARFYVPGRPVVKKNTKRVYGSGAKKRVVYTGVYQFWEAVALRVMKSDHAPMITEPVQAEFVFYFKNRKGEADVSNLIEGPQDALVKAGKLKDDRLIRRVIAEKKFGFDEAYMEIVLKPYVE